MSLVKSKWLVKSENRILGPYTSEQIEELVSKKQISLIDEIRDMGTRWSYIREIEEFKVLVEVVRNEIADKSDLTRTIQTTTSQMTAVTKTSGAESTSKANTEATSFNKENVSLTEINLTEGFNDMPSSEKSEAFMKTGTGPTESIGKKNGVGGKLSPPSSLRPNQINMARPEKPKSKALWLTLGLGLCISLAAFYFYKDTKNNEKNKSIILTLQKLVFQREKEKAIQIFEGLKSKLKEEALVKMIPYWIDLDQMKIYSLEQSFTSMSNAENVNNENLSDAELVRFNIHYQDKNFSAASQAVIKSLSLQPLNEAAHENDALLYYTQENYAEASKKYKQLYDNQLKGRFLVMYLLSQIMMKESKYNQYNVLIDSFLISHVDFKKELLLLKAYFMMKLGNHSLTNKVLNDYFEFPFQVSSLFSVEPLVYASFYNWRLLDPVQDQLLSYIDSQKRLLLTFHDLVEKGEVDTALVFLDTNKSTTFSEENYYAYKVQLLNLKNDLDSVQWINEARAKGYRDSFAVSVSFLNLAYNRRQAVPNLESYLSGIPNKDTFFNDWIEVETALAANDKNKAQKILNKNIEVGNYFLPYIKARSYIND